MKIPGANKDFCSFNTWAQTCMVIQMLAVLGTILEPKRLISRRHREFLPSVPTLRLPYPPIHKTETCRCRFTDVWPCRELGFGWQSQKLELHLLSHCISHRLSFLYPGANSRSTCYSDHKNVGPFHTPYPSETAPQRNYSRGRQWELLLNNTSSFRSRKRILLPDIT